MLFETFIKKLEVLSLIIVLESIVIGSPLNYPIKQNYNRKTLYRPY